MWWPAVEEGRRRWRERRGDEEEAARQPVVEAEEMEAGHPHSAQQETTHVARSPSYSPVSRPATPVTERRAAATAAAAAQPVATALSLLRVGSGRAVDGVADGPHGRTLAADRRLVVMDDGAPLSVEEVLTTADTLDVIMGLLSLADLLVAAQVCKALKGWAWLAHALLPLKTKLPYLVDGGLPEGMLRNRWTCPSREGQLGATALGAAQTAVRVLRLNGRLLEPLAAYYRQEYDLTHHLDGPVCDAARRMFRNAPRPSSPTAYLLQLQQAASAWSNAWQTWGLDATLRRGLYSFFASRLWLLVRSRGGRSGVRRMALRRRRAVARRKVGRRRGRRRMGGSQPRARGQAAGSLRPVEAAPQPAVWLRIGRPAQHSPVPAAAYLATCVMRSERDDVRTTTAAVATTTAAFG